MSPTSCQAAPPRTKETRSVASFNKLHNVYVEVLKARQIYSYPVSVSRNESMEDADLLPKMYFYFNAYSLRFNVQSIPTMAIRLRSHCIDGVINFYLSWQGYHSSVIF